MRKILLLSATALCGSLFSQIHFKQTRFGAKIGLNNSRVSNAHNPSGERYSFQAGALALVPIGSENQFFIQPEISYYGAGETGKDKAQKGRPGYDAVYANNYISTPIYFKAYFSEAQSEFFGMVGPRFNFLVNQKVSNPSKPYYIAEQLTEYANVNGKARNFSVALSGALGYSYKRKIETSLQVDYGLSNIYPGLDNETNNSTKTKREVVLSLGINYIFD